MGKHDGMGQQQIGGWKETMEQPAKRKLSTEGQVIVCCGLRDFPARKVFDFNIIKWAPGWKVAKFLRSGKNKMKF